MEELEQDLEVGGHGFDSVGPRLARVAPFSPVPPPAGRGLSSRFGCPRRPVESVLRNAYISLEGRLVNAEEASSSRVIGGLTREEAVAWELFTPMQRFLLVAVTGVAVAESKKNRLIRQLEKSVNLRDQVLSSMQEKLDGLCEQLNCVNDQSKGSTDVPSKCDEESLVEATFGSEKIRFIECGCWLCDKHDHLFSNSMDKHDSPQDEMLHHKSPADLVEQEERRMSDMSDWCSSVASASEILLNNLMVEPDVFNFKKECEEKDATIKELTSYLSTADKAGSKRISELEEIIRRKNFIIKRLRKDMMVLEEKVSQLTRLRRTSSTSSSSNRRHLPVMMDNLLYDMDSSTGSSSSESDTPPINQSRVSPDRVKVGPFENIEISTNSGKLASVKSTTSQPRVGNRRETSRPSSPLKERSMNQKSHSPSFSSSSFSSTRRHLSASRDSKKSGRPTDTATRDASSRKRWM